LEKAIDKGITKFIHREKFPYLAWEIYLIPFLEHIPVYRARPQYTTCHLSTFNLLRLRIKQHFTHNLGSG